MGELAELVEGYFLIGFQMTLASLPETTLRKHVSRNDRIRTKADWKLFVRNMIQSEISLERFEKVGCENYLEELDAAKTNKIITGVVQRGAYIPAAWAVHTKEFMLPSKKQKTFHEHFDRGILLLQNKNDETKLPLELAGCTNLGCLRPKLLTEMRQVAMEQTDLQIRLMRMVHLVVCSVFYNQA